MKQGATSNFYFIEPMMALRAGDLPIGNWIYELKFDGYRALAFEADKDVRLVSRNRTNFNKDYPQLVDSLRLLTANKVTVESGAPKSEALRLLLRLPIRQAFSGGFLIRVACISQRARRWMMTVPRRTSARRARRRSILAQNGESLMPVSLSKSPARMWLFLPFVPFFGFGLGE